MINSIIEAISIALNEEFGDDYEIHMEEIKQGLREPCFFIACLESSRKAYLGTRCGRSNPFCIQYFPQSEEKQRECNAVAERLYECLEYVATEDDLSRGTQMSHQVIDGVLNFFVNYDFFTIRTEEHEAMDQIQIRTELKGEDLDGSKNEESSCSAGSKV